MQSSSASEAEAAVELERPTYVSFRVGEHLLAAHVDDVEEILDLRPVTVVPRTPALLRGVLDLRGTVIPVVDMRVKFGLERAEDTRETAIVVFSVVQGEEVSLVAGVVDAVHDVFEVDPEAVEPTPKLGAQVGAAYVAGITRTDDRLALVLRSDRIFSPEEIDVVLEVAAASAAAASGPSAPAPEPADAEPAAVPEDDPAPAAAPEPEAAPPRKRRRRKAPPEPKD